jgi:hypothetical protein
MLEESDKSNFEGPFLWLPLFMLELGDLGYLF